MNFPLIIYEDLDLIVLFKPSQYYVHPPENKYAKQKVGRNTCLHWLQDHHKIKADPIHRLDYATEGLVVFGKHKESTQKLNLAMRDNKFKKLYDAVIRGWIKDEYGKIDLPLELDSTGEKVDCLTLYSTLKKIELNYSVHSKFTTTRYSWMELELKTGRWHQIRRHMNRISHPVIGDREHGDSHHNRFFRDTLRIDGLCLRAKRLVFPHPLEYKMVEVSAPLTEKWSLIEDLFNTVSTTSCD